MNNLKKIIHNSMILTMIMIQIIAKVSVFLAQATKKMKIIM